MIDKEHKNAKEAGYKKITIGELVNPDQFSINGKSFFVFINCEEIGAGLVSIFYMSNTKMQSYDRVIRSNKKVYVAPLGRHYEG